MREKVEIYRGHFIGTEDGEYFAHPNGRKETSETLEGIRELVDELGVFNKPRVAEGSNDGPNLSEWSRHLTGGKLYY